MWCEGLSGQYEGCSDHSLAAREKNDRNIKTHTKTGDPALVLVLFLGFLVVILGFLVVIFLVVVLPVVLPVVLGVDAALFSRTEGSDSLKMNI